MKFAHWGQAFAALRAKSHITHNEIAKKIVGCNRDLIRSWERGESIPTRYQLKGLYAMMPQLRHFTALLPKEMLASLAFQANVALSQNGAAFTKARDKALQDGTFAPLKKFLTDTPELPWEPPMPEPHEKYDDKIVAIPPPTTFGESLLQARIRADLTQDELGELVEVSGQAISSWEKARTKPVEASWERLKSVLPDIVEPPDMKAGETPRGNTTSGEQRVGGGARSGSSPKLALPSLDKWRSRVREALDRATSETSITKVLSEALHDLLEQPAITARQVLSIINEVAQLAENVRRSLPVHVIEHDRSHPHAGVETSTTGANTATGSLTIDPPQGPIPPVFNVPELDGLPGAGIRYAVALAKHAFEAKLRTAAEQRLEEARLNEEIAKEELDQAHAALVAFAKEPTKES